MNRLFVHTSAKISGKSSKSVLAPMAIISLCVNMLKKRAKEHCVNVCKMPKNIVGTFYRKLQRMYMPVVSKKRMFTFFLHSDFDKDQSATLRSYCQVVEPDEILIEDCKLFSVSHFYASRQRVSIIVSLEIYRKGKVSVLFSEFRWTFIEKMKHWGETSWLRQRSWPQRRIRAASHSLKPKLTLNV